jgi:uncharacterized glyoxalase superfamily protein PhnB
VNQFREAFPILSVGDVDRAVAFYCTIFGFERGYSFEDAEGTAFAFLRLEPLGIGITRRTNAPAADIALWMYADEVDEASEALRRAGAEEVLAPTDRPWGERMCSFRDADGHLLHIASKQSS